MTDLHKAAEMALESMLAVLCDPEGVPCFSGSDGDRKEIENSIAALKEALAQPEQEPVAWRIKVHKYDEETDESSFPWEYHHIRGEGQPLYLHPAPAIPEGWKLVPKEPTLEMIGRARDNAADCFGDIWREMLDAAPKPEELK